MQFYKRDTAWINHRPTTFIHKIYNLAAELLSALLTKSQFA